MTERRTIIWDPDVQNALTAAMVALQRARAKHGAGAFMTEHEALGAITQEYHELVREKGTRFREELLDLTAACLHAIASLQKAD